VEPTTTTDAGGQEAEPSAGEEGSGEEPPAEKPAEMCEIANEETGEKLQIPCSTIAPSPAPSGEDMVEKLMDGDEGESNETTVKHCSKTVRPIMRKD
jgi:hypothetical protein